ncbi:hypothetical protein M378DRAFT_1016174, partial [Amanita muscaria Koide BX008]
MAPKRSVRLRLPSNPPAPAQPLASSSETQLTDTRQGSPGDFSGGEHSDDEAAGEDVATLSKALEGAASDDIHTALAPPSRVSALASSSRLLGDSVMTSQASSSQQTLFPQPTASSSRKGKERLRFITPDRSSSPERDQGDISITHTVANPLVNSQIATHTPSSPPPQPREHMPPPPAPAQNQQRDKRPRPVEENLDLLGDDPPFSRTELVSMLSNLQSSILEQCRQLVNPNGESTLYMPAPGVGPFFLRAFASFPPSVCLFLPSVCLRHPSIC